MHYSILPLALAATQVVAFPAAGVPYDEHLRVRDPQSGRPNDHVLNRQRADAVKAAFTFAWDGYYKYCKGQDELLPVTNTCDNPRNNWGATAVDALSTAVVMELKPIVNQILAYIPTIDYTKTSTTVSLFETTIRYLGGMLAGYDLLSGPLPNLAQDKSQVDDLLKQAKSLGDTLKYSFNTPSGIPSNGLIIDSQTTDGGTTNGLATVGTLVLEWQHLSDLTGDAEYGDLAQKAESNLLNPKPASSEPFPGLVGTNLDIQSGMFLDANGGWNGGDDSFYEYLIKMFVYNSDKYANYRDRWVAAADSTMEYLTSHPSSRPDLTFLASFENHTFVNASQHLTCFDGGNFILGGQVLKQQKYIDFGLALVNGCHDTYASTATGIGPDSWSWNSSTVDPAQTAFYEKSGFYITNPNYVLRPEVLESFYYAYRATGNQMYRDWSWDAFVAINATTRVGSGFSSINDVNTPGGGGFQNVQESFFFAEVMKYSYLIQSADAVWQVENQGTNQYVFNTEAHPFKVQGTPV